jgi:site-specific DNA-cytosine methylase
MSSRVYTCAFPFCGIGGGALGFLKARMRALGVEARFHSLGGIDNDPTSCREFERLTNSPALCSDVASMTPVDMRAFFGDVAPDVVFGSPPCRGFSGLLSTSKSKTPKYQAMNKLVLDWIELVLATWPDSPPRLLIMENVPRIASRGKGLLRKARSILHAAGYVSHGASYDAGELGGLAQHRRRYLFVARLQRSVQSLLYQPIRRKVRACGEVLGKLPMPGDPSAGPMHELPKISWLNWVRLSLIPAGGDWRDLEGVLADGQPRRTVHRRHRVEDWNKPSATVAGSGSNAVANIADPRIAPQLGPNARNNLWQVGDWNEPAKTVTGASKPSSGAPSVADPRVSRAFDHGYAVLNWGEPSATIAGGTSVGQGAYSVADIRVERAFGGVYGVLDWQAAAATITGQAAASTGAFSVADPRKPLEQDIRIIAADGTWHRPLTTLELAALQGFPTEIDGKPLVLAERNGHIRHSVARSLIGNAVPPPAAQSIAEQMLLCLMAADAQSFALSSGGSVWVDRGEELCASTQ